MQSKIDFSFLGAGLFACVMILMLFSIGMMIFGASANLYYGYCVAGAVIFSLYIIFGACACVCVCARACVRVCPLACAHRDLEIKAFRVPNMLESVAAKAVNILPCLACFCCARPKQTRT